ncbi:MAG TPA: hypothetical protein VM536_12755 [Chloroflexia bacterium]|nr:hypothetical protein [Chloroflexia bacterium]
MTRQFFGVAIRIMLGLAAIFALKLVGPAGPALASGVYHYNFEKSLQPWTSSAGGKLDLERGESVCPSIGTGTAVLHIAPISCCQGDLIPLPISPVYLTAAFPGSSSDTVVVDWEAKAPIYCEKGCDMLAYIGAAPPSRNSAWTAGFSYQGEPAWRHYQYKAGVISPSMQDSKIYVAVGFQPRLDVTDQVDKGEQTLAFDCLTVSIQSNTK